MSGSIRGGLGVLNGFIGLFNKFMARQHDAEMRSDGARQNELTHRDKQDEVRKDASAHRSVDNSATDRDVIDRL